MQRHFPFGPTQIVRAARSYHRRAELHRIIKRHGLTHYATEDWAKSETRARDLLRRAERATSWVPSPLYPAGGAAGPLLLYLLIRALNELPVEHVLELGAGQSTVLFDAWARKANGSVVSLEHDKQWAESVGSRVDSTRTRVVYAPLIEQPAPSGSTMWYTPPPKDIFPKSGFDLVLVDGPVGTRRLSRYGIVEHLPEWMGPEWLVLWDDLDRPADLKSFALLIERLRARGVPHHHVLLDGNRTVGLVNTPGFDAARYMW